MSENRNSRKVLTGVVIGDASDKTVVVKVEQRKKHPVYGKMVTISNKMHAHDENNDAGVGDKVSIMATRPLSRLKRWRLVEIIEKAK